VYVVDTIVCWMWFVVYCMWSILCCFASCSSICNTVFICRDNTVFICRDSTVFICRDNTVFICRDNTVFICRDNTVFICRDNTVFICRDNTVFICRDNTGISRDKYIPNPACQDSESISMYEVVGCFLGGCFRIGEMFPVAFAGFVWKWLLGHPLCVYTMHCMLFMLCPLWCACGLYNEFEWVLSCNVLYVGVWRMCMMLILHYVNHWTVWWI